MGDIFSTSVFRKKTFTGLSSNYFSNIFHKYKMSCITTLLYRAYRISATNQIFQNELNFLKSFFQKNHYPLKLINSCIRNFLNKINQRKDMTHTAARKKLYIKLPFIGIQTNKFKSEISCLISKCFPQCNASFYFRKNRTISSFFPAKEVSNWWMRSHVIYEYICDCCMQSYIGSTAVQLFKRVPQHQGVSFRTGRPLNSMSHSSIRDHCNSLDHRFKIDNFKIIDTHSNPYDLRTLEAIHIGNSHPSINDNQAVVPLFITF